MGLGNFFSREERLESLQRQFEPGRVLYLHCNFTRPQPKNKFLVLLAISPKPVFFIINSEISSFIRARQNLLSSQILLRAGEYEFLEHDSYLDCTVVIDALSLDEIITQLLIDLSRIKGVLNESSRAQILDTVAVSKTLSDVQKLLIGNGLGRR
ncbi:MAG: hypothetical protein ACREOO_31075 [bacterium]